MPLSASGEAPLTAHRLIIRARRHLWIGRANSPTQLTVFQRGS
jgi:hypothetical protein